MTARILTAVVSVALLSDAASAQQFRRQFPIPQPTFQPPLFRPLPVVVPVSPVFPQVNPFPSTAVGQVVDPFTGTVTRFGTTTDPFTGTTQQSSAQFDPFSGTTLTNDTVVNPFTGAAVNRQTAGNPITGKFISTTRIQRPILNPFPLFPR